MDFRRSLLFVLAVLATATTWAIVPINQSTFPDEAFRNYILGREYGADGVLTNEEIAEVTFMFADEGGFQNLKGIEYFTALNTLYCSSNQLTELDVSKNTALVSLYCGNNKLTSLNVAGCTQLRTLSFYDNLISGETMDALINALPDLRGTDETGGLYAFRGNDEGNRMTDAQLLAAQAKGWVTYYYENYSWYEKAPEIEVNERTFPDENFRNYVLSRYGEKLTSATIQGAKYFYVNDQNISSLQGIEYFTEITDLYCYNNNLTELDLSKNTKLTSMYCYNNKLTSLNVAGCSELTVISLYQNRLKGEAMDALIDGLPDLISNRNGMMLAIYFENEENQMTFAQVAAAKAKGWTPKYGENYTWTEYQGSGEDVEINAENFPDEAFRTWILEQSYGQDGVLKGSELPSITIINVSGKGIKSLKGIEHFPMLAALYCSENQLTELDVTKNVSLGVLSCDNNQLSELDLSNNTTLTELYCYNNQITGLDFSNCKNLTTLHIYKNQISEAAMGILVASLPQVNTWWEGTMNVIYDEEDQNIINTLQVEAAKTKGWSPKRWDYVAWDWVDYAGSEPDAIVDIKAQLSSDDTWYDLSGRRLKGKPSQKGIYINGGRKVTLN